MVSVCSRIRLIERGDPFTLHIMRQRTHGTPAERSYGNPINFILIYFTEQCYT
jgi:hypothetical protein